MALSASFKILALGPNPAFQKVLTFDKPVEVNQVNRAASVTQYVGGKGQGVALALNRWAPGSAAVAHFLGGDTGKYVEAELSEAGVAQLVQQTAAPTRTCTTLLAAGQGGGTELIDPSGTVAPEELSTLLDTLAAYIMRDATVGGIALCGTTPPGADALYASMATLLSRDDAGDEASPLLLLDGHKQVADVLGSGRVDILKINVDEALALTQCADADAAAAQLLWADAAPLTRPHAIVAFTDGGKPARLFTKAGDAFSLQVPTIDVVNAIGAGDVCTGVFLHALVAARAANGGILDGRNAAGAFALGLAASCARCKHQLPTKFTREEVEAMRSQIAIS